MHNFITKSLKNNFGARLITTPTLVVVAVFMVIFNSGLVVIEAPKALAAISTSDLLEDHNTERIKAGLEPLQENKLLANTALQKALAMLEYDCWDHYCPEGKSPWEFYDSVGYDYLFAGENLAEGYSDIDDVMIAWMNSSTHRANVLKPEYREVGFAVVQGYFQGKDNNTIVVAHFGTQQPSNPTNVDSQSGSELVSTPVISDPRNGSFLNALELPIIGSAPDAEQVTIYSGTKKLAKVDVDGGVFTYKISPAIEEEYNLTAIANTGGIKSKSSDLLTVTIDRSPDIIPSSEIQITNKSESNKLSLSIAHQNLRTIRLRIGNNDYLFNSVQGGSLWESEIDLLDLQSTKTMTITTVDLAGNTWTGELPTGKVLSKAQSVPVKQQEEKSSGQVLSLQTKTQVNSLFLILMVTLFGLDFLALALTGTTKLSSRSHLHLALLLVIGIIIITGAFSGNIAQGLALN